MEHSKHFYKKDSCEQDELIHEIDRRKEGCFVAGGIKMVPTTLCYIENEGSYLMLHRVSKRVDINKGKWIGVGGKFEEKESPEECLLREVKEETGLTLTSFKLRGVVTFVSDRWVSELMFLYTADGYEGELTSCHEGVFDWVPKKDLHRLNLWEGDKIFLRLLEEDAPFFSLKLSYEGDDLVYAALDGRELSL